MRTKVILSFILILLIMLTFAGLAGAQIESPTYVPPPVTPQATPSTSGGMAVGYSALIGLLLITTAVPFLRK